MTAKKKKPQIQKSRAGKIAALIISLLLGVLTVLLLYAATFAPDEGFFAGMRGIARGLGGDVYWLTPLVTAYYCIVCAMGVSSGRVPVWRTLGGTLLLLCLFGCIHAFFFKEGGLSWVDNVVKAYKAGIGGGALGAVFAAIGYKTSGAAWRFLWIFALAIIELAVSGRLKQFILYIKKTSHSRGQERLARDLDRQFETDTLLDDIVPERAAPRPKLYTEDVNRPRRKKPAPSQDEVVIEPKKPAPGNIGAFTVNEKPAPVRGKAVIDIEKPASDTPKPFDEGGIKRARKPKTDDAPVEKIIPVKQLTVNDLKIEPEAYETPDEAFTPTKELGKLKKTDAREESTYDYPPLDILAAGRDVEKPTDTEQDMEKARLLEFTLNSFGIKTKLTGIAHGPAVTRFELQPAPGVMVSKITSRADDIALNLAATSVRIEAPIPGKAAVGVEVPNDSIETVHLRDVLESADAKRHPSRIAVGLGKDNSGRYIVADIAKMPHVLIAGQTGSGKSVCINSIIASILYRASPDEVKMILIDPKVVELSVYNEIPHLIAPVVTDPKKAASALDWAVVEMKSRYDKFSKRGVRDIKSYNKSLEKDEPAMPHIVIIIDELADLMMVAPGEVEESICRLAQLARAAGMHLVIATQRPSVNVITGIIKANIPTRIAFLVSSQIDSRTIIDHAGAEKLLGYGDMLFVPSGIQKPLRVQGAWISDEEVRAVTEFLKLTCGENKYDEDVLEKINNSVRSDAEKEAAETDYDARLPEAIDIVLELGQASISMLQRRMHVGYARAGRLIDDMAQRGIVSEADGAKPRSVLITREQFEKMFEDDK